MPKVTQALNDRAVTCTLVCPISQTFALNSRSRTTPKCALVTGVSVVGFKCPKTVLSLALGHMDGQAPPAMSYHCGHSGVLPYARLFLGSELAKGSPFCIFQSGLGLPAEVPTHPHPASKPAPLRPRASLWGQLPLAWGEVCGPRTE